MLKKIFSFLFVVGLFFLVSCADENLSPILTFDKAGKGAYIRLLQESSRDINLFNIAGSKYTYSVEFVDLEKGALVSQYTVSVQFIDKNPANGNDSKGPLEFRTWAASDFGTSTAGFKSVENITITPADLVSKVGITTDKLQAGDQFVLKGTLTLKDGATFSAANSSASVRGASFLAHFDFTLNATCPTALAGTYDVNVTDVFCPPADRKFPLPYATKVTWKTTASGYDVTDFSFGIYDVCYGKDAARPLGDLRVVDVCNKISIIGKSQWQEVYTWKNFKIDGNKLTVDWVNDYGEGGSIEVINPKGWPALTLK